MRVAGVRSGAVVSPFGARSYPRHARALHRAFFMQLHEGSKSASVLARRMVCGVQNIMRIHAL
ncbi:hypothetical protein FG002_021570 [Chitinimonas sp. BJB300]|nr:hypothetical protein FG002_021570 [Chitinimonas sp. BJB300]